MVKSIIWTKKRVIACLLTVVLAVGCLPFFEKGSLAEGESGGLQPVPNYYTTEGQEVNDAADADITLSKTAERIGPDEWEVTVEAVVGNKPVQKRQLEFVFVLDISSSMLVCADHSTSHEHDEDCGDLICGKNLHTHDSPGSGSECYTKCEISEHYKKNGSHKDGYDCVNVSSGNQKTYYYLSCTNDHTEHTAACFKDGKLTCNPKNIVHGNKGSSRGGCTCEYDGRLDDGTPGRSVYNRLNVAKEAAENLITKLPTGTTVHRVTFHGEDKTQSVSTFYGIENGSGTYMMEGIDFGIDLFSKDAGSKKILVVLTDGESSDGNSSTKLTNFKADGGTVFTIGFSYSNDKLEEVASEDGDYLQASSAEELDFVMDQISSSITAMLEDPMSPSVSFIPGSIDEIKVAEGKFETVGETIYWYPQEEGSTVADKTIKYSYTVKLDKNDEAMSAGSYSEIPLNNPTYFLFAVTETDGNTTTSNTVRAEFPIPEAEYSVASLQVMGKVGNQTVYTKEMEQIIADTLPEYDYTPAFSTSYAPLQYYTNGSNYYRYKGTSTYTADGDGIDEDQIDPAAAAAYVVVHEYEQISENEYKNLYPVTYQYTYQPKYAPDCPDEELILKDTENVEVAGEPQCEGYAFSGWTTSDVTVSADGTFTMPAKPVVFTGTWTKLDSYQVVINYYTKTDGVAADKPDGTRTTQLQYGSASQTYDFEYPVEWDKTSYTADRSLVEGSETLASFVEGENKLTDITPATPTNVITINLYREVTNEYKLNIKHVFQDGSTHEGYNADFESDGSSYQYNSSWQVTPKEAPTGYAWVESKSGEAANDTDTTPKNTNLSGDTFGAADKYVIITYEKLPSYQVIVNYYTKTDGGEYQLDNTSPVIAKDVTYGKESGEAEFSSVYNGNSYSNPQLVQSQDGVTIEGNRVKGIQPTTPTNVVTINLYRAVTNDYKLYVKHVFQDGSTHEGYNANFESDRSSYQYNSGWQVTPKEAPTGYAWVESKSGEAANDTDTTLKNTNLSGDAFGAADKYVIITYEKLPSYKVLVNYYTKTDGGEYQLDNTSPVIAKDVTYGKESGEAEFSSIYNDNSYSNPQLAQSQDGVTIEGNKVKGIQPTDSTNVVTINLYREVTNEYKLNIKHVFQDGSTHEGYNTDYAPDGSSYQHNSGWQVTPKEAPTGYAWVESKSGEATSSTVNTLTSTALSGTAFGAADKYVIITYEKLPSYQVVANYYTKTDGGEYQLDNTSPVIAKDVTYGKESGEAEFSSIYKDNSYSQPQLAQPQDGVTIEGNKVKGIQPATPTNVITINLYRTVTNDYKLYVKHVFQDGSTHEGYNTDYANDGSSYQYSSSWQVTPKEAPTGYALVADESGVATSSTVNTLTSTALSGTAFGAADKYVIITYEKLPSYQVVANYYTKTDGGEYQLDNTSPVIAKDVTYGKESGEAEFSSIYNGNSYSNPQLVQSQDGVTIEGNKVKGIQPTTPTKVVTINLYREVTNEYKLNIKHVFQDDSTHEGYNTDYATDGSSYQYNSGWQVTPKEAPTGYAWVESKSGEAANDTDTTPKNTNLSGDAFGAADKYVIITYEKLPSYQVIVNYYTITDGETPVLDNTITNAITYTKDDGTYQCETTKANNQYGDAELSSGNAQLDAATALLTKIVPTDSTNVVTINLYRTVQTPAQYQVSHQYYEVDLNGNRTLVSADSYTTDPVTMNHGDTVAASGLTTDPDGKTDAVTYTEVSRTPESITLDKDSTQTITITYERYQAPITVHYVDTEGTPLMEDYTETLFAGDAYDLNTPVVQIIEILKDGVPYDFAYDDTDDDTGYAGVLPRKGVEITLVYQKRGKATAMVQYVDEDGNALQLPLMTEEMYIGEPYDVSEALQVQQITLGGSEYAFDHHFQTRAPLRSVGSLTFVEDVDYQGAMPPGGIQITRVYRLGKVTYYYQQKNVYTAYDADGNVVYSSTQEFPILTSEVAMATLNALESFEYEGYGFWRVSEETMTADLTGTAPDKPYVFIVYYEFRQGDEPVPDTQLPPGITAPESTPQPTATAPVDTLPPQTGDEGVALWQWLMVLASAGLVLMLKAQRKARREER